MTRGIVYPRQKYQLAPFARRVPVDGLSIRFNADGELEVSPTVGAGDMMRGTYDTDGNDIVDDAEKLGGNAPSFYTNASNINAGVLGEAFIDPAIARDAEITYKTEADLTAALNDNYAAIAHTHNASDITAGVLGEAFIDPAIARDSEIVYKTEADLTAALDDNYAAINHVHDGSHITTGIIDESVIDAAIARDSEIVYKTEADLTAALNDNYAAITHTHNASDITAGVLGEAFIDPAIARDSEIVFKTEADLTAVLNDNYAAINHVHDGSHITTGIIDESVIDAAIARDSEIVYKTEADLTAALNDNYLSLSGGTLSGNLSLGSNAIGSVGSLAIGSASVATSAALSIDSTSAGFLPPRMTSAQRDAIASPADGLVIYNTTESRLNVYQGGWKALAIAGPKETLWIVDEKASGANGGSAPNGNWYTRTLNTIKEDTGGNVVSLASNVFTLKPGTYECMAEATARSVNGAMARLWNVTDNVEVARSASHHSSVANIYMPIVANFTITQNTQFRLDQYNMSSQSNDGHGKPADVPGYTEIYTNVRCTKPY